MTSPPRDEKYWVDPDERPIRGQSGPWLMRTVVPLSGEEYTHRCSRWIYVQICHLFHHRSGLTIDAISSEMCLPHSQVAVAVAFLLERGIIERHNGANRRVSPDAYLDGMTEFSALLEKGPPDPAHPAHPDSVPQNEV